MTQLSVHLPDLQTTVRSLAGIDDRLAAAHRRVAGLEGSEAGAVAGELEAFADHWAHGVRTLRQHVGALHAALADVHDAYHRHEHDLVRQLTGGAS